LGEGVKLARIKPGRNQVIPGPFGGGTDKGRSLDLVKAVGNHPLTDGEGYVVTKLNPALHPIGTEVQVAVG